MPRPDIDDLARRETGRRSPQARRNHVRYVNEVVHAAFRSEVNPMPFERGPEHGWHQARLGLEPPIHREQAEAYRAQAPIVRQSTNDACSGGFQPPAVGGWARSRGSERVRVATA